MVYEIIIIEVYICITRVVNDFVQEGGDMGDF